LQTQLHLTTEPIWRTAQREFLERNWDGEALVFDVLSGATHHLNQAASAVWSALRREGSGTVGEIRRRLGSSSGDSADHESINVLIVLAELRHLALVETHGD